jgi:hypothetical protein
VLRRIELIAPLFKYSAPTESAEESLVSEAAFAFSFGALGEARHTDNGVPRLQVRAA